MLAIVSAIVAFDRWPQSGNGSVVERIAVDRTQVRHVETVVLRAHRAPVVRRVVRARGAGSATTSGAASLPGAGGDAGGRGGGGFGPPPPPVPPNPPGEGGPTRVTSSRPASPVQPEGSPIREAACGARDALAGACQSGRREGGAGTVGAGDPLGLGGPLGVAAAR